MSQTSDSIFSSTGLAPEELEEILQQIDANLHARPLLQKNKTIANPNDLYTLSAPPPLRNYMILLEEIHNSKAPYYVVSGNIISKLIKKAHNFIVKIFGSKQAYYNQLNMNLLQSIIGDLQTYQAHFEKQTWLINILSQEVLTLRNLQNEMQNQQSTASSRDINNKKKTSRIKTK